jgi:hypothetical protein
VKDIEEIPIPIDAPFLRNEERKTTGHIGQK